MNIKFTINQINSIYKNIKCISVNYKDNKSPLQWQCLICDFIFTKSKNGMDRDFTQCQNCKKNTALNRAIQIIRDLGGICLSTKYIGVFDKIKCKCKNDHIFSVSYNNLVHNNGWCAQCGSNKLISENICKKYFENLFGYAFIKFRPNWLKNTDGYQLELDGYCEKLGIAFEHNGTFHYEDKFNRLEITQKNDKIKYDLCLENNVNLIIVPILFKKTPLSKLRNYIISECNKLKINVPFPDVEINLSSCYDDNGIFEFYKNIAISKGGKCLSQHFIGVSNDKMLWECREGHQWQQFAYAIKKGHWCPICAGQIKSPNIIKP